MKEQYEEVRAVDLNPGDVVHVSFDSESNKKIYLNETVEEVACGFMTAESKRGFHIPYSRFYLVKKAKKPLPTEFGAVVEHTDGWRFMRVGGNRWVGVGTKEYSGDTYWTDEELVNSADGDSNWKRVA